MAYRYLGSVLVQLEQPAAATHAYREALLLRPHDASLHTQLGQSLVAQADEAKALTVYQQALKLDPKLGERSPPFRSASGAATRISIRRLVTFNKLSSRLSDKRLAVLGC